MLIKGGKYLQISFYKISTLTSFKAFIFPLKEEIWSNLRKKKAIEKLFTKAINLTNEGASIPYQPENHF